jgi:hypothetical protein
MGVQLQALPFQPGSILQRWQTVQQHLWQLKFAGQQQQLTLGSDTDGNCIQLYAQQ